MLPFLFYSKKAGSFFVAGFIAICLLVAFRPGNEDIVVRGKVVDGKGAPVAFASVVQKNGMGTQTNADGLFSLIIKSFPATIRCTALGFDTNEFKLYKKETNPGKEITITLTLAGSHLDEVVVVGIGSSKRSERAYSSTKSPVATESMHGVVPGLKSTARADRAAKEVLTFTVEEKAGREASMPVTGDLYKRSKLLTAGELNDFKKWKMWEDYSSTDFKTFSEQWGLFATQRFCVQLQNNQFKPLIGRKIYLLNKTTGDSLWTAISDNTGKAELWANFSSGKQINDLVIAVEGSSPEPAYPFSQGIQKMVLREDCVVSDKVEIAFVVDATGSMGDEIEYLKEELGDILTKVSTNDPGLQLNTGAVFYRDKGDEYVTSIQDFSPGINNTINFIKKQRADGGGDYPEALREALTDAIEKLKWTKEARTRIIFLLMDAPPHAEAKDAMQALIKKSAAMGIRIVPVACSGTDKATEFIMRSIALATNGSYLFLTDHSGIGNSHIRPTTDEFKVELLNDLLQRTLQQMCYAGPCDSKTKTIVPVTVFSNIEKLKVFPNPTKGPVVLESSKALKEILVADFTGKILFRKDLKNKSGSFPLDLSAYPSGTYFIRYTSVDNISGAEKLVLAR